LDFGGFRSNFEVKTGVLASSKALGRLEAEMENWRPAAAAASSPGRTKKVPGRKERKEAAMK